MCRVTPYRIEVLLSDATGVSARYMFLADVRPGENGRKRLAIKVGLWRKRGTVRTSVSLFTKCAASNALRSSGRPLRVTDC